MTVTETLWHWFWLPRLHNHNETCLNIAAQPVPPRFALASINIFHWVVGYSNSPGVETGCVERGGVCCPSSARCRCVLVSWDCMSTRPVCCTVVAAVIIDDSCAANHSVGIHLIHIVAAVANKRKLAPLYLHALSKPCDFEVGAFFRKHNSAYGW